MRYICFLRHYIFFWHFATADVVRKRTIAECQKKMCTLCKNRKHIAYIGGPYDKCQKPRWERENLKIGK